MMQMLWTKIDFLEDEIRRIRSDLLATHSGRHIIVSSIKGIMPPSGGGSGISGSPLGVTMWENQSGATRSQGAVVVESGADTFSVSSTQGDRRVIGVLDDDGIIVGAVGRIRHIGRQSEVDVTGAVAAGDYLRASVTAGRAESTGADRLKGTFARALTAFAGPGDGQVAAFLGPYDIFDIQQDVTAKGDIPVGAASGDLDIFPAGADGAILYYLATNALGLATRAPGAEGTFLRIVSGVPNYAEADSSLHQIYIPFGSTTAEGHEFVNSSGVTAFTQFGTVKRIINPDWFTFDTTRIVIEVVLKSNDGTNARARLWDITDGVLVGASEVVTSLTTPQRLRSNYLTLDQANHEYRIEIGSDAGGECTGYDAVMIIGDTSLEVDVGDYSNILLML